MFSTKAEHQYFKEFQDFSVGIIDDGLIPHYNGITEEEYGSYYKQISDQTHKLKVEIETNLIFLSDTKEKTRLYLQKMLVNMLEVQDKLDWYEDETHIIEEIPPTITGNFLEILWRQHFNKLNKLIDYVRLEITKHKPKIAGKGGRKPDEEERIGLKANGHQLYNLYTCLSHNFNKKSMPFIDKILLSDFQNHFAIGNREPSVQINWEREEYLLTYLFDRLMLLGKLDKNFKSNCNKHIAKHFTCKGKQVTPRHLTSARNTFNKAILQAKRAKRLDIGKLEIDAVVSKTFNIKASPDETEELYGDSIYDKNDNLHKREKPNYDFPDLKPGKE